MIIKAHRFHGFNALRHVYNRGQTARGPLMAVKYVRSQRQPASAVDADEPVKQIPPYRAAVVVSRKVHKSAVVRGRIRRRLYEVIRLEEPSMPAAYDFIVTVFSDQLATLPASELRSQLQALLAKAGIIGEATRTGVGTHAIVDVKEPET